MATVKSIGEALDGLNEALVLAEAIGLAVDEAVGPDASGPMWLFVYRRQLAAVQAAAVTLETIVRCEVVPVLERVAAGDSASCTLSRF